jgi:hypothetical protein
MSGDAAASRRNGTSVRRKLLVTVILSATVAACGEQHNLRSGAESPEQRWDASTSYAPSMDEPTAGSWSDADYGVNGHDDARVQDGTYSADVDYLNPTTGYSGYYSLDVEVEGGEITQIYFPNGGWLDNSEIMSGEIFEDGSGTVETYDGRTFEVQIEP